MRLILFLRSLIATYTLQSPMFAFCRLIYCVASLLPNAEKMVEQDSATLQTEDCINNRNVFVGFVSLAGVG